MHIFSRYQLCVPSMQKYQAIFAHCALMLVLNVLEQACLLKKSYVDTLEF